MKIYLLLFAFITGCSHQPKKDAPSFSTVDSNVIDIGDSVTAILHIDTTAGSDTAFYVAMDSMGYTITAKDTAY